MYRIFKPARVDHGAAVISHPTRHVEFPALLHLGQQIAPLPRRRRGIGIPPALAAIRLKLDRYVAPGDDPGRIQPETGGRGAGPG